MNLGLEPCRRSALRSDSRHPHLSKAIVPDGTQLKKLALESDSEIEPGSAVIRSRTCCRVAKNQINQNVVAEDGAVGDLEIALIQNDEQVAIAKGIEG